MNRFSAASCEKVHSRFSESPLVDRSPHRLDTKRHPLRANELVMKDRRDSKLMSSHERR